MHDGSAPPSLACHPVHPAPQQTLANTIREIIPALEDASGQGDLFFLKPARGWDDFPGVRGWAHARATLLAFCPAARSQRGPPPTSPHPPQAMYKQAVALASSRDPIDAPMEAFFKAAETVVPQLKAAPALLLGAAQHLQLALESANLADLKQVCQSVVWERQG